MPVKRLPFRYVDVSLGISSEIRTAITLEQFWGGGVGGRRKGGGRSPCSMGCRRGELVAQSHFMTRTNAISVLRQQ